ncbi:hypothetical protein D0Z03_000677 [Geotrichum reessii]|nr:hypothetical protein D0Z03_000677 [Galactomyces reessii]
MYNSNVSRKKSERWVKRSQNSYDDDDDCHLLTVLMVVYIFQVIDSNHSLNRAHYCNNKHNNMNNSSKNKNINKNISKNIVKKIIKNISKNKRKMII